MLKLLNTYLKFWIPSQSTNIYYTYKYVCTQFALNMIFSYWRIFPLILQDKKSIAHITYSIKKCSYINYKNWHGNFYFPIKVNKWNFWFSGIEYNCRRVSKHCFIHIHLFSSIEPSWPGPHSCHVSKRMQTSSVRRDRNRSEP